MYYTEWKAQLKRSIQGIESQDHEQALAAILSPWEQEEFNDAELSFRRLSSQDWAIVIRKALGDNWAAVAYRYIEESSNHVN